MSSFPCVSEAEAAKAKPPRVKKPGKWEAVMNKIEEGKQAPRSEIKSRLFAELPRGGSTVVLAAPQRKLTPSPHSTSGKTSPSVEGGFRRNLQSIFYFFLTLLLIFRIIYP